MEAWFISDIHLKSMEERNGKILLRFLHSLRQKDPAQIHLFMLGDIFDLWVGGHSYFGRKFQPLMDALQDLKMDGARITYIEGNHDVNIDGYFQKKLGVEVFVDAQYYQLDGLVVRVEHGDLINQNDTKYLRYRSIIRDPRMRPLGEFLPGFLWDYIGNKASKKSRTRSSHYVAKNAGQLEKMITDHTPRAFNEKSFDIIISGHMHVFVDVISEIDGRAIRTVNLGSWYEESIRAFHLKDGQGEWVHLETADFFSRP